MFLEAKVKRATCSGEFQREKLAVGEYPGLQGTIGRSSFLHLQIIYQLQSLSFHMVSDLHSGTAYLTGNALGCIYVP